MYGLEALQVTTALSKRASILSQAYICVSVQNQKLQLKGIESIHDKIIISAESEETFLRIFSSFKSSLKQTDAQQLQIFPRGLGKE